MKDFIIKHKIIFGIILVILIACIAAGCYYTMNKGAFDGKSYKFINYDKYVKVGDTKDLTYEEEKIEVTNKDVMDEVNNRVNATSKEIDVTKGKTKKGDKVSISYKGKIGGKEFAGGSAENSIITIGETQMIKGFVEGITGKDIGSTQHLKLKFPKDYINTDVAGKNVEFDVTINSVKKNTEVKYDDEFVKKNSKYKTKKEYENAIRKELTKNRKEVAESNARQTVLNQITNNSKVKKYPKKQVTEETKTIKNSYKEMAKQYNMSYKDLLSQMNTTQKEIDKQAETSAKENVKQKLVVYSLAKKYHVDNSNKAYEKYLDKMLKDANFTRDTFKQQYNQTIDEYAEENNFRDAFVSENVSKELAKIAKKNGKKKPAADNKNTDVNADKNATGSTEKKDDKASGDTAGSDSEKKIN